MHSKKYTAKIEEVTAQAQASVEAVKAEFQEIVSALEAKVASVQAPEVIRAPAKTVRQDVNRACMRELCGVCIPDIAEADGFGDPLAGG